jgi:prepilin-type N-terminal cleavage/methylation domain-containing protein
MRTTMKNSRQGGMTLIEMIGALAIGSIMMAGLSAMIGDALDDGEGQQAALYQAQVVAAARRYIGANYQALLAATPTAASVATVDIAMLKAQHFLPDGFAPRNGFQQTSCVLLRQPVPGSGKLDALIVGSGGQKIADKNIAAVAAGAGQGSGYIAEAAPGTARGASWSMATAAYQGAKCPGAAVAALGGGADDGGHLVSNLFFDGPGQLSTDFLYRNEVPGRPELNQMRAPIHMAPGSGAEATENDAGDARCTVAAGTGKVAVDAKGRVLSCQSGVWRRQGSAFWRDPVETFAALPAGDNQPGDVRMVLALGRAFSWSGSQWLALAVDQDGNLSLPGRLASRDAMLNRVVVAKTACEAGDPDGTMARDASGLVMSCQFGLWQSQTNLALQASDTACAVILPSSVAVPNPDCSTPYHGPRNWYQEVDTWEAEIKRQLTPTKNGLINVNVWTKMNRGLANNDKVSGQVRLQVDIVDNDTGASIGHTDAQSVRIENSSATINATLSKTVQRNRTGYSVWIRPAWTTFEGPKPPYTRASFRSYDGSVVEQVPLSTGWSMDLFQ